MDLKSLRERKAMLTESAALERIIRKPPFSLNHVRLNATSKNILDTVAVTCKILKPVSLHGHLESAINLAAAEFNHRIYLKQRLPNNLKSEAQYIMRKRHVLPSIYQHTSALESKLRDQLLNIHESNTESDCLQPRQNQIEGEILEEAEKCQRKYIDLVTDAKQWNKLQEHNNIVKERLKKIPDSLGPGYQLSKENLQALLDERRAHLEELKHQVLEDSSF